jgi:hypothetical protein
MKILTEMTQHMPKGLPTLHAQTNWLVLELDAVPPQKCIILYQQQACLY